MEEKKIESVPKTIGAKDPTLWELLVAPFSEALFVLLPLIVIAIVYISSGKELFDIFSSPEWSFGSAVFFGLAITKLVSGTLRGQSDKWEVISLFAALAIVFGLVPSLTILSLLLSACEPPIVLVLCQIFLFIVGFAVFLVFGIISHYGLFHAKEEHDKN